MRFFEDNYSTYVCTFNRTYMEKTLNGTVVEWHRYEYNESNQLISEKLYNGKKTTNLAYTYDADGNRVFLLNYNLHTDDDWKGNSGNGNGNNKVNSYLCNEDARQLHRDFQ